MLGEGKPGQQNRHQDKNIPQPIGARNCRVGVATFALQGECVGKSLCIEDTAEIDFRPALSPFVSGYRSCQTAHAFRRALVDRVERGRHFFQMLCKILSLAGSRVITRWPICTKVAGDIRTDRSDHSDRPVRYPASVCLRFRECVVVAKLTSTAGWAGTLGGAGNPRWRRWCRAHRPILQVLAGNPSGASVRTDCTTPASFRAGFQRTEMSFPAQDLPMPTVSDLDAAMLQPARSVPAVRRLGGGQIRMNDAGRPLRAVGHDAVIYELRTPIGRILALRCLLTSDSGRDSALAHRYEALRSDPRLEHLRSAGGALPRDIHWVSEGIAFAGPDLRQVTVPIVAMERVPGRTLLQTVDRLCREGQSEPLALLAESWVSTATALEHASFVHGDLAADNLIVRPDGSIALVDLDTASWPTLGVRGPHQWEHLRTSTRAASLPTRRHGTASRHSSSGHH